MGARAKQQPQRHEESSALSKSTYTLGLQCHKALYLRVNHPESEPAPDDVTRLKIQQGKEVGIEARAAYTGGVLVTSWGEAAVVETRQLLRKNPPAIFEATFSFQSVLIRVDILKNNGDGTWDLIEVKSSTKLKPEHIPDLAIQWYVITNSGISLSRAKLRHINSECCHPELEHLFSEVDCTHSVTEALEAIPNEIRRQILVLEGRSIPPVDIGPQCSTPRDCSYREKCWEKVPEKSIFMLPNLSKQKVWDLYRKGIVSLSHPKLGDLTELQSRVVESAATGKRFVDGDGIRQALATWRYPLTFLDFETVSYAIPKFPESRPYQQLPFQFSVHIKRTPESQAEHYEFLNTTASDPRLQLIKSLLAVIPSEGSIVAYYGTFESTRLKELAENFPEYQEPLKELAARVVDPLPCLRAYVYDAAFMGGFGLKRVAPALLGPLFSYDKSPVADGGAAQAAYLKLLSSDISAEERKRLEQHLLEYCRKDTWAVVKLVEWLEAQIPR